MKCLQVQEKQEYEHTLSNGISCMSYMKICPKDHISILHSPQMYIIAKSASTVLVFLDAVFKVLISKMNNIMCKLIFKKYFMMRAIFSDFRIRGTFSHT